MADSFRCLFGLRLSIIDIFYKTFSSEILPFSSKRLANSLTLPLCIYIHIRFNGFKSMISFTSITIPLEDYFSCVITSSAFSISLVGDFTATSVGT